MFDGRVREDQNGLTLHGPVKTWEALWPSATAVAVFVVLWVKGEGLRDAMPMSSENAVLWSIRTLHTRDACNALRPVEIGERSCMRTKRVWEWSEHLA